MKTFTIRSLAAGLCGLALTLAPIAAQDTVWPAFGNTAGGQPFDIRAAANEQPWSIQVKSNAIITRLQLLYCGRNMASSTGQSVLVGDGQGVANGEVFLAPGEYVRRVDVWSASALINFVRIYTPTTSYEFGTHQANETRHNFVAPAGEQVVGLHGSASINYIFSLGVITRPLLASHVRVGSGCATSLGNLRIRFRSGAQFLIHGTTPIIESPNVPNGSSCFFIYGFSNTTWSGLPLPYELTALGSPGCFVYESLDFLVYTPVEPGNVMAHTMDLVNVPAAAIGGVVNLQALIITGGQFKTSDMLRASIGRI